MKARLFTLLLVALEREGKLRSPWAVLKATFGLTLFALFALPRVAASRWRSRMRACFRCEIFDRKTYRCRQGDAGCGCSMPMKNLFSGSDCWARQHGIEGINIGWPKGVE